MAADQKWERCGNRMCREKGDSPMISRLQQCRQAHTDVSSTVIWTRLDVMARPA
jgi:hypothetical protein